MHTYHAFSVMTNSNILDFDDVDFGAIGRELALLEREHPGSEILQVLNEGRDLGTYKKSLAESLHRLESELISTCLSNYDGLLTLYRETSLCDSILAEMESTLGNFGTNLRGVSDDIRQLQSKSEELSTQLKSRVDTQEKLTSFVEAVVLSPDLISTIFEEEDCSSERFISAVQHLTRKRAAHASLPMDLPPVLESAPELVRLANKANGKIREFLVAKINALKQPKSNIQQVQQNSLVGLRKLMSYLRASEPVHFQEVVDYYVSVASKLYSSHFKQYVSSLTKLQLETTASKNDLLGTIEGVTPPSTGLVGVAASTLKLTSAMADRGNVFSISGGRDRVIREDLDAEAIVVTADVGGAKHYPETLLRSHQKMLCDFACSENSFLGDLLDISNPDSAEIQKNFDAVFARTLAWVSDQIVSSQVRDSFDTVGLLLSVRIIEYFQDSMINRRKVAVLDSYFEALLSQMRVRLRTTIELNTDSIRKLDVKKISLQAFNSPFFVTRRFGEFAAAILFVKAQLNDDNQLTQVVAGLVGGFDAFLIQLSKKFHPQLEQDVFLLNNIDLILSIFQERGVGKATSSTSSLASSVSSFHSTVSADLPSFEILSHGMAAIAKYEDRMAGIVSVVVEKKLSDHFGPLIKFTTEQEKHGTTTHSPASVMVEMERIVVGFQANWKLEIGKVQKEIFDLFSNLSTASEVLKNAMTQLLLYYTRFQKVVTSRLPPGPVPNWTRQLVPSGVIMAEIKQIQNMFV